MQTIQGLGFGFVVGSCPSAKAFETPKSREPVCRGFRVYGFAGRLSNPEPGI